MLAVGTGVGLGWNFVFYYFFLAGAMYFGRVFGIFYTVAYPLLNIMWVVPFWSLSLGFLPKMQSKNEQVNPFD